MLVTFEEGLLVERTQALKSDGSVFKFCLHLHAGRPPTSCVASLRLIFLICEMVTITTHTLVMKRVCKLFNT